MATEAAARIVAVIEEATRAKLLRAAVRSACHTQALLDAAPCAIWTAHDYARIDTLFEQYDSISRYSGLPLGLVVDLMEHKRRDWPAEVVERIGRGLLRRLGYSSNEEESL